MTLGLYLLIAAPCSASEAIQYPLAIPEGCYALAEREGYPTMIANRWEGLKARAKLARMRDSDSLVHQCKDAVAQAIAASRATEE